MGSFQKGALATKPDTVILLPICTYSKSTYYWLYNYLFYNLKLHTLQSEIPNSCIGGDHKIKLIKFDWSSTLFCLGNGLK